MDIRKIVSQKNNKFDLLLITGLTSIITRNIISGGNRLKAIRYRDEEREIFDNKSTLYCNIASILGFGFSSIITLNTNVAFTLMWLGIVVDNIFYYIVYKEESKNYKEM